MGGFRDRSLHVEMKDRLRAACALLGQAPPAGITHARSTVAADALANEIDVDALIGRPMALEIVEEGVTQAKHLEASAVSRRMADEQPSRSEESRNSRSTLLNVDRPPNLVASQFNCGDSVNAKIRHMAV
jgi:hypothetical protein